MIVLSVFWQCSSRYILDNPQVGGVIVGVRLGIAEHIHDNLQVEKNFLFSSYVT